MTQTLLDIQNLEITFPHRLGDFTAVRDFSLTVKRGEIVGLIGESGAGKSTVGNAVMGLLGQPGRITSGQIQLGGQALDPNNLAGMSNVRGQRIGMIFQDPMTSLNPLMTIGEQLMESISHLQKVPREEARQKAIASLDHVGIPDVRSRMAQYPHEFSGGMRQRVVIALALAGDPDLLIADEPTTALDVSVQQQVLDLIKRLCAERDLGVVLVTHDMGVIAETADRVYVMRYGKCIETGPTRQIIDTPSDPYTQQLIAAIPSIDRRENRFQMSVPNSYEIDDWLRSGHSKDTPGVYLKTTPLIKDFTSRSKGLSLSKSYFRAVDVPELSIDRGEVVGVVGESGSGKSTLGRLLTGLLGVSSGAVDYTDHGDPKALKGRSAKKAFRRDVQVVFQDPYSSLNSRMRVEKILAEPILFHGLAAKRDVPGLVRALLERVGLDETAGRKYPHQFSGGQRQRICIARALAVKPRFILCDEPTSALDVSIQAEMLSLLMELKRSLGLTMMFVSHDLAVIRQVSDRIIVMRRGQIEESRDAEDLFTAPESDYTKMLLDTAPRISRTSAKQQYKEGRP